MDAKFTYAIVYVSDMETAIAFYRDTLGLPLRFASPFWTEFATGDTTIALHPATGDHQPGGVQLGFRVPDVKGLYEAGDRSPVEFVSPLREQQGTLLGPIRAPDGGEITLST